MALQSDFLKIVIDLGNHELNKSRLDLKGK